MDGLVAIARRIDYIKYHSLCEAASPNHSHWASYAVSMRGIDLLSAVAHIDCL
jgi:hypothetical protein